MSSSKKISRIDVFSELTSPKGTFDYEKCSQMLGDYYDNFVRFCDAIDLIPEDIESMKIVEVCPERNKVIYSVTQTNGEKKQFET